MQPQTREGIILRAISGAYTVHSDGQTVRCCLRGNLRKTFEYATNVQARRVIRARTIFREDIVAVGDRVRFTETRHGAGVIEEVLPRTTRFCRAGFRGREQVLVCNIDQILVVFSCADPKPDLWKLDRFLVAGEVEGFTPIIIANKADLVGGDAVAGIFAEHARAGYRVIATSAKLDLGLETLCRTMQGRVSAVVGPSGVGKSSLLNRVQPGLDLRTAEVGLLTHKGRHTTTAAHLIPLRTGGWVADTPGLRQLDILDAAPEEIADAFPEFHTLEARCRFDDCRHKSEPNCAVKEAVETGGIAARRHQSYLILAAEAEAAERR